METRVRIPSGVFMNMTEPKCKLGYPLDQLQEILGIDKYQQLMRWMRGQTMGVCDGRRYNYDTREYEPYCDGPPGHGGCVYPHDLERFLAGRSVID